MLQPFWHHFSYQYLSGISQLNNNSLNVLTGHLNLAGLDADKCFLAF